MLSRIEYVLTETLLSLRRHPMMAFAATTCIAATLFVAGIVALALYNAGNSVDSALQQVRFMVFFHPNTSRDDAWAAYVKITRLEGVNPDRRFTEFRPKEQFWTKLQKEDPKYVELIATNPVPDAVSVQARDVANIPTLMQQIRQWPEVNDIRDAPEVTTFLQNARRAVGKISMAMTVILLLLSLVIVHHTIELTLYARRKEIHIMSLVGAAPSTVALPFLLEGIIYGVIGAGAAFGFLYMIYHFFAVLMKNEVGSVLMQSSDILSRGLIALLIAGTFLGLSGSIVSVVKYLRRPRSKVTNA